MSWKTIIGKLRSLFRQPAAQPAKSIVSSNAAFAQRKANGPGTLLAFWMSNEAPAKEAQAAASYEAVADSAGAVVPSPPQSAAG